MYEKKAQPIASKQTFALRLLRGMMWGCLLIIFALIVGMVGYHFTEGLSWLDSFLNASMILSGMGPVAELKSPLAKVFAGCYALFSGLIFVTILGIVFAPVIHRFLHTFHHVEKK